jgi:hypothetical protein
MLASLSVVFTGIKCVSLVNLSTTTMMESHWFTSLGSLEWAMVVEIQLVVYAQPLPFDIIGIWICNQPPISSFLAKIVGFLQLQLVSDIMGAHHKENCAFPSTLYFSSLRTLAHIPFPCA